MSMTQNKQQRKIEQMASEEVVKTAVERLDNHISRTTERSKSLDAKIKLVDERLAEKLEEIIELGLEKQSLMERWADCQERLDDLGMEKQILQGEDEPSEGDEAGLSLKDNVIRDIMGRKVPREPV